jgi:serine/threonine protein kinase/predicted esterase
MGEPKHTESARERGDEEFEGLLARAIEFCSQGDRRAAEEWVERFPDQTARLRARLRALEQLGLIEPAGTEGRELPSEIGGHRILRRLGSGGMGEVFLAVNPRGERVALKWARLAGDAAGGSARLRERFEREARATQRLSHPNVAALRDSGEQDGSPWFTLEFVEGTTLAALLARLRALTVRDAQPRLGDVESAWNAVVHELAEPGGDQAAGRFARARSYLEWAVRVALDVAGALAHVHAHGIVHRDVKPSNVMVRRDGSACLLDLGLAHFADLPGLTRSGDFAGTPYYVAPEQIEGERGAITPATDVWGLGVTLFEAVTLERPFEGAGTPQILRRISESDPPRPTRLAPGLPGDLEAILLKALEKAQRRRYPRAADLAEDLERFLAYQPVKARPASALQRALELARRRPALAAAWVLGATIAVGLPIGLYFHGRALGEESRRTARAAQEAKDQSAARARAVEQVVGLFRPAAGGRARVPPEIVEALDQQVERLQAGETDNSLARATWLEAVGTIYRNMGLPERALPLLDRALAARTSSPQGAARDADSVLEVLATVHAQLGHAATARALCERIWNARRARGEEPRAADGRTQLTWARAWILEGDTVRAREHLERAVDVFEHHAAEAGPDLATALRERGRLARELGDAAEALADLERALGLELGGWLPDPESMAEALRELAALRRSTGAESVAQDLERRAAALKLAASETRDEPALPPLDLEPPWRVERAEHFQRGISALQTGDARAAAARFERCLELRGSDGVVAYNLACAQALSGARDAAFAWLERAHAWGWGQSARQIEVLLGDGDLASLRGDPRFAELVQGLEQSRLRMEEFVRESSVVQPPGPAPERGWGALVVLHDAGQTELDASSGTWREWAAELGLVLVAPSGRAPLGAAPELGLAWFGDLATFAEQPWSVERPILAELDRVLRAYPVDPARVILAGTGQGGTVAFDLALRAPGKFCGVLATGCSWPNDGAAGRARVAAALGQHAAVVLPAAGELYGLAPNSDAAGTRKAIASWLRHFWGANARVLEDSNPDAVHSWLRERAKAN